MRFKIWIGQKLCDFCLWTLNLGPKDAEDRKFEREVIDAWKQLEAMKK